MTVQKNTPPRGNQKQTARARSIFAHFVDYFYQLPKRQKQVGSRQNASGSAQTNILPMPSRSSTNSVPLFAEADQLHQSAGRLIRKTGWLLPKNRKQSRDLNIDAIKHYLSSAYTFSYETMPTDYFIGWSQILVDDLYARGIYFETPLRKRFKRIPRRKYVYKDLPKSLKKLLHHPSYHSPHSIHKTTAILAAGVKHVFP